MDKLPLEVKSYIRSSITIRNYTDAVSELIFNSLDADSTSVAVRVNIKEHRIQVVDNGQGIRVEDMMKVGRRHMTSKCKTLQDLKCSIKTFGFRGEALASIINLSEVVTIDSLHYKDSKTFSKKFYKGIDEDIVNEIKMRPCHGTTVTIENFLHNTGVRQRAVDSVLELEDIRLAICRIALLKYYVSFTLRDDTDGKLVLKTHKSLCVREASGYLFDSKLCNTLLPINVKSEKYGLEGYISTDVYNSKMFQYTYINGQYIKDCDMTKVCDKIIRKKTAQNELLKNFNNNTSHPVFIMNILCPYDEYDITLMPNKSIIQFKHTENIKKIIKMFVCEFVKRTGHKSVVRDGKKMAENKNRCKNNVENDENLKLVKDILNRNAEEFGASQMNNAVKGKPARRFKCIKEAIIYSQKTTKSNSNLLNNNYSFFLTPVHQSIENCLLKENKKNMEVDPYKIMSGLKSVGKKKNTWRETPFILSQVALQSKAIVKTKSINAKAICIRNKKNIGVNVNVHSKNISQVQCDTNKKYPKSSVCHNEHVYITNTNNLNHYKKCTQTNMVHVNYDSHKNYHLANQRTCSKFILDGGSKPINTNKINEIQHSVTNVNFESIFAKNNLFDTLEKYVDNNNYYKNLPVKVNMMQRSISKTSDLLKTILPEAGMQNNILCKRKYFNMEESLHNSLMCMDMSSPKKFRDSTTQTSLESHDIDYMIYGFELFKKIKEKNYESNKFTCLYDSLPNIKLNESKFSYLNIVSDDENVENTMIHLPESVNEKGVNHFVEETLYSGDPPYNLVDCTHSDNNTNNVSVYFISSERDGNNHIISPSDFHEIIHSDKCNKQDRIKQIEDNCIVVDAIIHEDIEQRYNIKYCESNEQLDACHTNIEEIPGETLKSNVINLVESKSNSLFQTMNFNTNSLKAVYSNGNENSNESNIDKVLEKDTEDCNNVTENSEKSIKNINNLVCVENELNNKVTAICDNHWDAKTDSCGKTFYINSKTGMTHYENSTVNATVFNIFKRPNFVPKGMSPILKLGETNWKYGNRIYENSNADSKIKFGELYYDDEAYKNFAAGIQECLFNDVLEKENVGQLGMALQQKKVNFGNFRLTRDMIKDVQVINQIDKKFICCSLLDKQKNQKFILLFDQHAVHERIQLEMLIKEYKMKNKWKTMNVPHPIRLNINADSVALMKKYEDSFHSLGISYSWNSSNAHEIDVTTLPSCFQITDINEGDSLLEAVNKMISEELDVMRSTKGNPSGVPAVIMKILTSHACHTAVRFGTYLSVTQCSALVKELGKCDAPFQCAHGRPAVALLFVDDHFTNTYQVKKINYGNIKRHLKNVHNIQVLHLKKKKICN